VYSGISTHVLLWAGYWAPGSKAAAGTPCSTYGLAPGARTTKAIEVSAAGLRRCV
jgi:hypothetical protein